jgi:60 kDa SS-A/Ro ribonucleoprotein
VGQKENIMSNYGNHYNTKNTRQDTQIPGKDQVQNSDGCYVFAVDKWTRLDRFLILGTEGGSYYAKERELTVDNAQSVLSCIQENGVKVVETIVEVSEANRAPKNDPAIFALAMAAKMGNIDTRREAYAALPKVCRIPTHLFHFAAYCEGFGGWGRGMRRAVTKWYTDRPSDKLAYHLVKYQSRDGWSNRDLLRLSHAKPKTPLQSTFFKWVTSGELTKHSASQLFTADDIKGYFLIEAFEMAKRATVPQEIVTLIKEFGLPHEAIPTQFKKDINVQAALFEKMPLGAMIRNLGNFSKCGLLTPMSSTSAEVVSRLNNEEALQKAKIHPLQVLVAMNTYSSGSSFRGSGTWDVVQQVVDALDAAFYKSFGNIEPAGKRTMLALDTSGSMTVGQCGGMTGITPRVGAAAMALITANVETQHLFINFSEKASELSISPRMRLNDVTDHMRSVAAYGTNCAAPMERAIERGYEVDTFIVYTDSETNLQGARQPVVALRDYRQKTGINAKLVVVGMVSNGFTIADPSDEGMLDVVGFDTSAPGVISNFSRE